MQLQILWKTLNQNLKIEPISKRVLMLILGSVIGLEDNMDIYPGLNLGTRNFGAHLGFRYFFTDGFGVYTEMNVPIAEYDSTPETFGHYNNQFTVSNWSNI